jgi:hypothetical protein
MNMRLSLLALIACFGFSITAHASDIAFDITGGTFLTSGTFFGSFLINSTTEMVDGGSITATVGGNSYTFYEAANDSSIKGAQILTNSSGDTFLLALDGSVSALAVNTIPIWGTSDTTFTLATGTRYDATGALINPAVAAIAPEPSSLLLFGTSALGLAGSFRRRFVNS